jgi:hypothetical protein
MGPYPDEVFLQGAQKSFALGHPNADWRSAKVTNHQGFEGSPTHDTYVDVDVTYDKAGMEHHMMLRFYVESTEPCIMTVDVLSDTGPMPILLDNAISAEEVGKEMCEAITTAGL